MPTSTESLVSDLLSPLMIIALLTLVAKEEDSDWQSQIGASACAVQCFSVLSAPSLARSGNDRAMMIGDETLLR